MRGPKPTRVSLELEEKKTLRTHLRSGKTEWRLVRRARILLDLAEGINPCQIAAEVGCGVRTVSGLRERFEERGIDAIYDAPRSGRPPEISPPRTSSDRQLGVC